MGARETPVNHGLSLVSGVTLKTSPFWRPSAENGAPKWRPWFRSLSGAKSKKMVEKSQKKAKLLKKTRIFASRAVNVAKLSHISATIWRPLCAAPPGVAGAPGAPLRHCCGLVSPGIRH